VRFQVTRALDAIELRLRTDPVLTGAVIDLNEAVRLQGHDNRPTNLLRLGLVIDALSRQFADESVALYAVGARGVLSDTDLTSNERMVLRRWSDDGFIEIIPAGTDPVARVCEVAWGLGLPVITGRPLPGFPGARLTPIPAAGSLGFIATGAPTNPPMSGALSRLWRCQTPGCPSFPSTGQQPPPQVMPGGVPVCPRHGERLADAGQRPQAVAIGLRVNGLARYRFALSTGAPLTVGRAPDGPGAVVLGPYLTERIAPRVSRSHLRLELRDGAVVATDLSSNGSLVNVHAQQGAKPRVEAMVRGQARALGEWDAVELAEGVEIGRADRSHGAAAAGADASSVMRDAPTIAMRLPPM
jgi:hypothetical protein